MCAVLETAFYLLGISKPGGSKIGLSDCLDKINVFWRDSACGTHCDLAMVVRFRDPSPTQLSIGDPISFMSSC